MVISRKQSYPKGKELDTVRESGARSIPVARDILLSYHELPSWLQDNEYVISGYRPVSGSFRECFKGLRHVHNESVNMHSHLYGSVLFIILPFIVYKSGHFRYNTASTGDIVVFSTFISGVAICFFLSALFHITSNHSAEIHRRGNQLDYLGIVILMWGSTIPSVFYGFYYDPHLQKLYWFVVTAIGAACVYATVHPKFHHPTLPPWRAVMYAGLGLSALVFITHGLMIYGWEVQKHRMSLKWMGLMGALNLIGAMAYACRIPERWYPGRHDLLGSSHQILHSMVIFAGLAHMFGLLSAFDHIHFDGSKSI